MNRRKPAPNRAADLLCVLRRGHLAGADRPDRLVGDYQARHLGRRQPGEAAIELDRRKIRDRIAELRGLRDELPPDHAAALLSAAGTHETWHELVHAYNLSWDHAEQILNDALARAILTTIEPPALKGRLDDPTARPLHSPRRGAADDNRGG